MEGELGLTRFSYQLMARRLTITEIHHATAIPVPTLSMYANGHRSISASHQPIIAAILGTDPDAIVGYCTTEIILMPTTPPPYDQDNPPVPEPDEGPSHPLRTPDDPK